MAFIEIELVFSDRREVAVTSTSANLFFDVLIDDDDVQILSHTYHTISTLPKFRFRVRNEDHWRSGK